MNRPPADQPPRQITLHLQPRSASLSQGRPPGWLWTSATIHPAFLPAASPPEPSGNNPPVTGNIHAGKISFPLRRSHHEPHDSAGAHRRACARIADSVWSWDLLRKFVNGKEAAKVADVLRNLQPLRHLLHLSFVISDLAGHIHPRLPDRDNRTHHREGPGAGVGQHDTSRKNSTVRSVGVDSTKEALTALSSLHCSCASG